MNPLLHSIALTFPRLADESGGEAYIGYYIFVYSALVMATILIFGAIAKKGIRTNGAWTTVPARLAEHSILFANGLATGMMGPRGKKYGPFLFGLWSFIFIGNLYGLILNQTPTADWSLNLGMALVTMGYVQFEGIKENGIGGHILHFSGPKMTGGFVIISGLLMIIEIISECFKLLSLSIRLFANIHGGHQLVTGLSSVPTIMMHNPAHPTVLQFIIEGLPIGGLLLPLKVLACVIQAFVWVILTATYISLVTSHEDHSEEDSHDGIAEAVMAG